MTWKGFSLRCRSRCGVSILAGGLCRPGDEPDLAPIQASLTNLDFSDISNALGARAGYELDRRLADALQESCGPQVLAGGACAALPGLNWHGGGVLGSPRHEATSARGIIEDLGEGLCLMTRPGGPGLALAVPLELARLLFPAMPEQISGLPGMHRLYQWLLELEVPAWLALSDGSGPEACGSLILKDSRGCSFDLLLPEEAEAPQ